MELWEEPRWGLCCVGSGECNRVSNLYQAFVEGDMDSFEISSYHGEARGQGAALPFPLRPAA